MKVILKQTIDSLGIIGSEVNVANGYARNYLLPQDKAVPATPKFRKLIELDKKKFEIQIAKEREIANQMAEQLKEVKVQIKAKVTEVDSLYGSITVKEIAKALKEKDIKIDKKMIMLAENIKKLGTYQVPIRIYKEVEPKISVEVVAE